MEKTTKYYIYKKHIRAAYVFSFSGIGIIAISFILISVIESVKVFSVAFAIGILLLVIGGGYFYSHKCKCPSCGFGSRGRFDSKFHAGLSPKKQLLICPRCKSEIELR